MHQQVEVVYENGVLRPLEPLPPQLQEHQHLTVTIDTPGALEARLDAACLAAAKRDADPTVSPAEFYVSGSLTTNGGTSLAGPLATGVWARLQSHHHNQLGHAGPALYGNYLMGGGGFGTVAPPTNGKMTGSIAGFHDIIIGWDGDYTALPGYDLTTGMGSLDINATFIWFGS